MFVVRGKSGKVLGKYHTKAEAARRVAQVAANVARLAPYRFGGGRRRASSPLSDLRRFTRAELIAALGLEPEGRSRQQKYAATTDEFRKRIAQGASRADIAARHRLGLA
jgi:hypothetical protein